MALFLSFVIFVLCSGPSDRAVVETYRLEAHAQELNVWRTWERVNHRTIPFKDFQLLRKAGAL